jgi:hypothetical protein
MQYDLVWANAETLSGARPYLKRHPNELLIQNRWTYGWSIKEPVPMPDETGAINPKAEPGLAIMIRQPGIVHLKLAAVKDGVIAALPHLELFKEDNYVCANIRASFWQQEHVQKEVKAEIRQLDANLAILNNERTERQARNEARITLKLNLFGKYKKAVCALMGANPKRLDDEVISDIFLMSQGRENVPAPEDYLQHYKEQLTLEEEPEFMPKDDIVECRKFLATSKAAVVQNFTKVKEQ